MCWQTDGAEPSAWLKPGCSYVSSVTATLTPHGPLSTSALVGRRGERGETAIVGLAVWSGAGKTARKIGAVQWPARSAWDYAIQRDDLLDLDGDRVREIGVREAIGSEGEWIRSTTWYRVSAKGITPVYHLTRHARTLLREERRDMVVVSPGQLRERVEIDRLAEAESDAVQRTVYDLVYRFSPSHGRFMTVSTRLLR